MTDMGRLNPYPCTWTLPKNGNSYRGVISLIYTVLTQGGLLEITHRGSA